MDYYLDNYFWYYLGYTPTPPNSPLLVREKCINDENIFAQELRDMKSKLRKIPEQKPREVKVDYLTFADVVKGVNIKDQVRKINEERMKRRMLRSR